MSRRGFAAVNLLRGIPRGCFAAAGSGLRHPGGNDGRRGRADHPGRGLAVVAQFGVESAGGVLNPDLILNLILGGRLGSGLRLRIRRWF